VSSFGRVVRGSSRLRTPNNPSGEKPHGFAQRRANTRGGSPTGRAAICAGATQKSCGELCRGGVIVLATRRRGSLAKRARDNKEVSRRSTTRGGEDHLKGVTPSIRKKRGPASAREENTWRCRKRCLPCHQLEPTAQRGLCEACENRMAFRVPFLG